MRLFRDSVIAWIGSRFASFEPDAGAQMERIRFFERQIGLPVRAAYLLLLGFFILFELEELRGTGTTAFETVSTLQLLYLLYVAVSISYGFVLKGMNGFPFGVVRYAVFVTGIIDAAFLAVLLLYEDGFDSILYWVFAGMLIRNSLSVQKAGLQLTLNVIVTLCYVASGLVDITNMEFDLRTIDDPDFAKVAVRQSPGAEPILLRIFLLSLLAGLCYGLQLLFDRQREAELEAQEFSLRQEQLHSAGRLAAEVAHQLKNPLGIINNASFTLQRNLKDSNDTVANQVGIIRDEILRADRIINELMGYSKLIEGKVEKLDVVQEIERAIDIVFPPGVESGVHVITQYGSTLPVLLAQRSHLEEVFVNLLKNAKEALNDRGKIWITADTGPGYTVEVSFRDDGPGIAPHQKEAIFEAYFTTKDRGTGLGMAIIKNSVEMYGGTISVDSELGNGATFVVRFPGRSLLRIRK